MRAFWAAAVGLVVGTGLVAACTVAGEEDPADSSSTGGKGDGSGGSSGGKAGGGDSGSAGAGGVAAPHEAFAGINVDDFPLGTAPSGCEAEHENGEVLLTLGAGEKLLLDGAQGRLRANGVSCGELDQLSKLTVQGGSGAETVLVDLAVGAFTLAGGLVVELGAGEDILMVRGTEERDVIRGGTSGESTLLDLDGNGTVDVSASGAAELVVSLGPGDDMISLGGLADAGPLAIEAHLYGDDGADDLEGGASNDVYFGGFGDDLLISAPGLDGADVFEGQEGWDIVSYESRTMTILATIGSGADDGEEGEGDEILSSTEGVTGGDGDDQLIGNAGSNELDGGPGDDHLEGLEGDDVLYGSAGNDTLEGGMGDDLLDGLSGSNDLDGGPGNGDICVVRSTDTKVGCEL